jgi:hypothetical protein
MAIGMPKQVGSFDIIYLIDEVDAQGAAPMIEAKTFGKDEIESVKLTDFII